MKYIYENHMGGFYIMDEELDWEYLYCEECGDSDCLLTSYDEEDEASIWQAASELYSYISDWARFGGPVDTIDEVTYIIPELEKAKTMSDYVNFIRKIYNREDLNKIELYCSGYHKRWTIVDNIFDNSEEWEYSGAIIILFSLEDSIDEFCRIGEKEGWKSIEEAYMEDHELD